MADHTVYVNRGDFTDENGSVISPANPLQVRPGQRLEFRLGPRRTDPTTVYVDPPLPPLFAPPHNDQFVVTGSGIILIVAGGPAVGKTYRLRATDETGAADGITGGIKVND